MSTDDRPSSYSYQAAQAKAYLEENDVLVLKNTATNLRDCLLLRLLSHLGCHITEALINELAHCRQRILPINGKTLAMIKEYIEREGQLNVMVRALSSASISIMPGESLRNVLSEPACQSL
jgi:hypothetical protein